MSVYRYFTGETFDRKVFTVYRAAFDENRILEEWKWQIPKGSRWETTKSVSEWYYIGNEFLSPVSEAEAMSYLPEEAKDMKLKKINKVKIFEILFTLTVTSGLIYSIF